MDLNGLQGLFRYLGGRNLDEDKLTIRFVDDGWYIMDGEEIYAGPYKTESATKGQLTRMRKHYTPASRRPNKDA